MTIESRAAAIAFKSAQRINGVPITLSRGVTSGPIALAVPGDTLVEAYDEEGLSSKKKVRDYLIKRTDFESILGAGAEPKRGDQIVETFADFERTFDVIELNGETFRKWDKAGTVYRIHTVEVEKVTTTGTTAGA